MSESECESYLFLPGEEIPRFPWMLSIMNVHSLDMDNYTEATSSTQQKQI